MPAGRCHCGAVVYRFQGGVRSSSICHCSDCRRCAGSAGIAWISVAADDFAIEQGEPSLYRSSSDTERYFCGQCGTGLHYINEDMLPGLVYMQTATLDEPDAYPPTFHVQMGDALKWERGQEKLPMFDRYPPD